MKRRVIQRRVVVLLLLLVGGAIVNVAVAWGFVKTVDISGYSVSGREHPRWYFIEHRGFGGYSVGATTVPEKWMPEIADWDSQPVRWPVRWGTLSGPPNEDFLSGKFERVLAIADGWPFLSLRKEFINVAPNAAGQPRPGIARGATTIRKFWEPGFTFLVPCIPIWPGFAINTIFYAAILWVVFFVPGQLKRTLRRRRGQCPACAYPVGTSKVCTECGAALRI